jgi:hypothetical protein
VDAEENAAPSAAALDAKIAVRALASVELDALEQRERSCDDAALATAAPSPEARVLTTRFAEARPEAKALLPLSVTEPLELPQLPLLESALSGVHGPGALARALERAAALRQSRFIGVFHVTRFGMPRWIWRIDRKKPEWVPGHVESWLALHDAQSGERMCQTRLWVENDTKDASLTRRLRADTRDRLTDELGRALEVEAPIALRRLSRVLVLPAKERALVSRLSPRPSGAGLR